MQFHKEQEEKQQQQQQKWEEKLLQQQREQEEKLIQQQKERQIQRKQTELFLKVLNKTESSENNPAFSSNTIWNSMKTFIYLPVEDKTFEAFFRRYEDLFTLDCED